MDSLPADEPLDCQGNPKRLVLDTKIETDLQVKELKRIVQANSYQERARVAKLVSSKIDFKFKKVQETKDIIY